MQRTLAVLLCALVAGAAATDTTLISGVREHHEAVISGIRQHHEAAISGLRAKFFSKHWMHHEKTAVSGAPGTTLTPTVVPTNCLSVAEVAQAAGNFSTLLAAAQAAGLAPALSDRSLQATVFAPTDAAFATALDTLGVTPAQLLAQPELLQAILKYHVVPGPALSSSQLTTNMKLPTLLAADLEAAATVDPMASWIGFGSGSEDKPEDGVLTVSVQQVYGLITKTASRRINIVGSLSSTALVMPDVNAGCPAVVHVIDNVLLPNLTGNTNTADASGMAVKGQEATGMFGSLMKLYGAM